MLLIQHHDLGFAGTTKDPLTIERQQCLVGTTLVAPQPQGSLLVTLLVFGQETWQLIEGDCEQNPIPSRAVSAATIVSHFETSLLHWKSGDSMVPSLQVGDEGVASQ